MALPLLCRDYLLANLQFCELGLFVQLHRHCNQLAFAQDRERAISIMSNIGECKSKMCRTYFLCPCMLIRVFDRARGSLSLAGASGRSLKLTSLIWRSNISCSSKDKSRVTAIALYSCINCCGNGALLEVRRD